MLGHYGVPYDERAMTVIFLQLESKRVAGTSGFPRVYGDAILMGFDAILAHHESLAPPERKLYPADPAQSSDADRLWKNYHAGIGFAAARWAYGGLLPVRSIMVEPLARGCPWFHRAFVWLFYWLVASLIRKTLAIADDTQGDLAAIRATFDEVDALLADGRAFLVGGAPTIADFGFAAMAVPAVWPPEYGGALPPFERLPASLRAEITRFRERPAGQFALRMYREFRNRSA